MRIIQFVYIMFLWGMPILIIWRSFRKMEEEKRMEVIKEIKDLSTIGVASIGIGLLIYLTGSVTALGIKGLQYLGLGLIFFGWIWIWVVGLVKGEERAAKSIAMIAIGVLVVAAYSYWF